MYFFREKHCENCLHTTIKTEDGKKQTLYFHKVLEAKIILSDQVVISIGTEFIENENEDVSKQDCELNAARRLLECLHEDYPRLPIVIQGDALYAVEPFMELCRETYHWEYLFTHKGTRQQILDECFEYIKSDRDAVRQTGLLEEKGTAFFENNVDEVAGKSQPMNLFEYEYEGRGSDGKPQKKLLQWVTSLELTRRNVEEMILAGRGRWKIENEGFNNQKNGIYRIEHLNSRDPNAMKNHYMLTQIADMLSRRMRGGLRPLRLRRQATYGGLQELMQLYLAWNLYIKELKQTVRHTCLWLLETCLWTVITEKDIAYTQKYTTIHLE